MTYTVEEAQQKLYSTVNFVMVEPIRISASRSMRHRVKINVLNMVQGS